MLLWIHPDVDLWWLIIIRDGFFIGDKSIWIAARGEWTATAKFNPPMGYNEPIGQTLCQSPFCSFLLVCSMGVKLCTEIPFSSKPYVTPYLFCMITRNQGIFLRSAAATASLLLVVLYSVSPNITQPFGGLYLLNYFM